MTAISAGRPVEGFTGARPAGARPAARPALRVVPATPAHRLPFAVAVCTLLTGGLLTLLFVNTWSAQDSFQLARLRAQAAAVHTTALQLAQQADALQTPAALATAAGQLGLVPGFPVSFQRLPDGQLLARLGPFAVSVSLNAPPPTAPARPAAGKSTARPPATHPHPPAPAGRPPDTTRRPATVARAHRPPAGAPLRPPARR